MNYLPSYTEASDTDIWWSAIELAWTAFNQPDTAHEDGARFIKTLPEPQRYALVCFLFEGDLGNGGLYMVATSMGLQIPALLMALEYFGAHKQKQVIEDGLRNFDLSNFPDNQDEFMNRWSKFYDENASALYDIETAEKRYWELDGQEPLREIIENQIRDSKEKYFSQTASIGR